MFDSGFINLTNNERMLPPIRISLTGCTPQSHVSQVLINSTESRLGGLEKMKPLTIPFWSPGARDKHGHPQTDPQLSLRMPCSGIAEGCPFSEFARTCSTGHPIISHRECLAAGNSHNPAHVLFSSSIRSTVFFKSHISWKELVRAHFSEKTNRKSNLLFVSLLLDSVPRAPRCPWLNG